MGSGEGRRPRTPLIVRIQSTLLHIVVYCASYIVVHISDTILAATYCGLLLNTILEHFGTPCYIVQFIVVHLLYIAVRCTILCKVSF